MKNALLKTDKKASFKTWWFKTFMNLYPMFFGTGGKVLFIADDWQEVHIRLRLNWWTRNYVGTIFGGSMFSASDPFYMLMLLHNLGKQYVVWDKSASIRFRRPAKKRIYAKYLIDESLLATIREEIQQAGETTRVLSIAWVDPQGTVYAQVERTVYMADKAFYKQKRAKKLSSMEK
ncbi:MAG: PaaI family thioesterase [Thermonemataceae bacterium]